MAMITCSECGRAISDKAAVCVGCGAPIGQASGMNLAPAPSTALAPTRAQIRWRLGLALLLFAVGIAAARFAAPTGSHHRVISGIATVLILGGLVGLIITLIQGLSPRE